jgi:hypothetical protein
MQDLLCLGNAFGVRAVKHEYDADSPSIEVTPVFNLLCMPSNIEHSKLFSLVCNDFYIVASGRH